MLSTFLSSLIGKLAIGTVALATTTGGLAATGNLPDPVQDWTAERFGVVGIPDSNNQADETANEVLDVIKEGDPQDGEEFGQNVAETASDDNSSDGNSSDGIDTAENRDDNANEILDVIEEGDPQDGEEFGQDVADTASDGNSSDGLDTAENRDDNADVADTASDDNSSDGLDTAEKRDDNADDYTEADAGTDVETPEQTDQDADNTDVETPQEDDAGADNAGDHRP